MKATLLSLFTALTPVLGLFYGLFAKSVVQVLRRASAWVDTRPGWQKAAISTTVVTLLAIGQHFAPWAQLPQSPDGFSADAIVVVLGAIVAHVSHKVEHPAGPAQS